MQAFDLDRPAEFLLEDSITIFLDAHDGKHCRVLSSWINSPRNRNFFRYEFVEKK
jgi:hypothetical protein